MGSAQSMTSSPPQAGKTLSGKILHTRQQRMKRRMIRNHLLRKQLVITQETY